MIFVDQAQFGNVAVMVFVLVVALLILIRLRKLQANVMQLHVDLKRINYTLAGQGKQSAEAEKFDETKLYVGNVDYSASEDDLAKHFSNFGKISMVNIPVDRYTGKTRGFGFVTFDSPNDAIQAIDLDGSEFKGRVIHVNFAKERND